MSTSAGGALVLVWLAVACTDNSAARVIEARDAASEAEPEPSPEPSGSVPPPGPVEPTPPDDAGPGDAGPGVVIPPLDAGPPDSGLTPLEEAEQEFERLYAMRCPDQPSDVMVPRGAGNELAAGPAVPSTTTRPQLSEEQVEFYTIEATLAGGGVYTATYTGPGAMIDPELVEPVVASGDAGADAGVAGLDAGTLASDAAVDAGPPIEPLGVRTVAYATEAWAPSDEIEDVTKIVPGLVVDPSGGGTNTTIQDAINDAVVVAGCPRVFIKILPGTYREKVIVPAKTSAPPLTLYSVESDAARTVIVYGDSTAGAEIDGTPLSVHYSATLAQSLPHGFQARNLTIENDYVEGTFEGDDQAAVAVMNQGDEAEYDNVRFLGHRNTLYVKSTAPNEVSRTYFRNCYVEGDEDYVLGRGAAVFDQCEFHSRGDRVATGAVTAPSTRIDNPHGILIINSEFSADAIVEDVYLGRQWPEGDDDEAIGKVIVRNSILGGHVRRADPWAPVERLTQQNPSAMETVVLYDSDDYYLPATGLIPAEKYVGEFGNFGPGASE